MEATEGLVSQKPVSQPRYSCRLCAAARLDPVLDLGEQFLTRFPKEPDPTLPKAPLRLTRCAQCGLLQLGDTVDPDLMFREYWYRSSVNQTMKDALRSIVHDGTLYHRFGKWVDIGANDGYLLSQVPPRFEKVGCEPARNLAEIAKEHCETLVTDYFSADHAEFHDAHVITSAAMFYDLDDPVSFVKDVARCLKSDGVWINQLNDSPTMLRRNAFDSVCLPAEEKVVAERGLVPICEIAEGERVLTHKGRYLPVEKTMSRDFDGELMVIRGYGFGASIRVTDNHPVLVRRDGRELWVRAGQVKVGDQVSRPVLSSTKDVQRVPIKHGKGRAGYQYYEIVASEALFAIGGYYLAEGFVHKAGPSIAATFSFGLSEKEKTLAECCAGLIRQFGFKTRIHQAATATCVTTCGGLARWLKETFGTGAGEKKIPAWVTQLPRHKLTALYSAYMQGDGYLYRQRYQRANTVSMQLAHDLALVATRLGFVASINRQERVSMAVIGGRSISQRPLWDVLVREETKRGIKCVNESGHQWGKVRSVRRERFKGRVYNISVAKDRTYVTPGGTVHNCHEHLTYYDVLTLDRIYRQAGLRITNVSRNEINGGSLRIVARKAALPCMSADLREYSQPSLEDLHDFARRVRKWKHLMQKLLEGLDGMVWGYGASTKGTVLLQYLGDVTRIVAVADRNPSKSGLYMVGSWLPITDEASMRTAQPDYLLVLPWAFKQEFVARERKLRAGTAERFGSTMIFPLPNVELVV